MSSLFTCISNFQRLKHQFAHSLILRSHHHRHQHQANTELGHLLIRSGLTHFEISLTVRSSICKPNINFTCRFMGM